MTKIQVDSNGKAIMLGGKALIASESGITPTGTLSITANGTYDVTNYASVIVNVSGGGSYTVLTTADIELEDTGEGSVAFSGDLFYDTIFYLILNNNTPVSFYTKSNVEGMQVANCYTDNGEAITFSYVLDTVSYDGSTFTVTCISRYNSGGYAFFTLTANF